MTLPDTYAIVGGGPAGLVTGRAFLNYGLKFEILERHSAIGGIWDIDNPGSPVYQTCNFISSRDYGAFIGFPMPRDYPYYPRWSQIRDYIRLFAQAYGLHRYIRTDAEVVRAEPVDCAEGRYWRVTPASGESKDYRGVITASGGQWTPFAPRFEGDDTFAGTIIHSSQYQDPSLFAGKRVLVVGAGNSGVDIAADASVFAQKAFLSTRRGYWILPKLAYGVPVGDLLQGNIADEKLPEDIRGLAPEAVIQKVLDSVVGDLTNYGLPAPDHELGKTHPITNFQILHALSHGYLFYHPDIARLTPDGVHFVDGTYEDIDVIVLATGYDVSIPWLPEGTLRYEQGHPVFTLGALVDGEPGLYGAGVLHFAGNTYPVFDQLVQLVAAHARGQVTGEGAEVTEDIAANFRPSFKNDDTFLDVRRNANHVDVAAMDAYFEQLESVYGIPIPSHRTPHFYDHLLVDAPELSPRL